MVKNQAGILETDTAEQAATHAASGPPLRLRQGFVEPILLYLLRPDPDEVFAPQELFGQVVRERAQQVTRADLAGVAAEGRQLRREERAHVERDRDGVGRRAEGVGLKAPEVRREPAGAHIRDEPASMPLGPGCSIQPCPRAVAVEELEGGCETARDREVV